jgi:CRISPR/Cas system CSM-associated protein Csm4 (group 5 of RAMP superfamily)
MMEIKRDDFRNLAAGHYVMTSQETTIKREDIDKFVQGSIFAHDFIMKQVKTLKEKTVDEAQVIPRRDNPPSP